MSFHYKEAVETLLESKTGDMERQLRVKEKLKINCKNTINSIYGDTVGHSIWSDTPVYPISTSVLAREVAVLSIMPNLGRRKSVL